MKCLSFGLVLMKVIKLSDDRRKEGLLRKEKKLSQNESTRKILYRIGYYL